MLLTHKKGHDSCVNEQKHTKFHENFCITSLDSLKKKFMQNLKNSLNEDNLKENESEKNRKFPIFIFWKNDTIDLKIKSRFGFSAFQIPLNDYSLAMSNFAVDQCN